MIQRQKEFACIDVTSGMPLAYRAKKLLLHHVMYFKDAFTDVSQHSIEEVEELQDTAPTWAQSATALGSQLAAIRL